ncbi:hypothetical protein SCMU_39400 [Sinomonas cyclohexanicum]|uniref:Uncharacterized protein n=1 Tax=Sinomonas cyclohexanicum TaxID=322009 RepID=A0ABM7Q0U6_SINCY|nr:hypothetical protein [Corynebacterium cyclohexanicum]BCT78098.1 hypothetical protein SCMU_39400 [Corynebacterium cyclohexanicum]
MSQFEESLWKGLNVDHNEARGRTRQQLWQWAVSVLSARAGADMEPVGDSMVVSLAARGGKDSPWEAFYCGPLGDDEWAQVDEFAARQAELVDWARRHMRGVRAGLPDFLDMLSELPSSPFIDDSPMRDDVPLVAPEGVGEQLNFWPSLDLSAGLVGWVSGLTVGLTVWIVAWGCDSSSR